MMKRMDFSHLSKVESSLKKRLMAQMEAKKQQMSDAELDMVAAAGKGATRIRRQTMDLHLSVRVLSRL